MNLLKHKPEQPTAKLATVSTAAQQQAGSLLAVEAIDRNGLVVTSEGALVQYIKVIPPNPLIMSEDDRAITAAHYCNCLSILRAQQSVQFYIEARPVDLSNILEDARREVAYWSGPAPTAREDISTRSRLAIDRWRLYSGMEQSLRDNADHKAAMQVNAYIIVPYVPAHKDTKVTLASLKLGRGNLPSAPLHRDFKAHHRAVRESNALTHSIRAGMEALNLPTKMLNGEEVASLLFSRFNPTTADGSKRTPRTTEILGQLDHCIDTREAQQAARRLRDLIAQSSIDFESSKHYAEIEQDIEKTIYVRSTAENTFMGWLQSTMMTRQPFALSVYVHALDRRMERQKIKRKHARVTSLNRGAEMKGRYDVDRHMHEQELVNGLAEMAGQDRATIYEISIYQSIRAPGPRPDVADVTEAADYCATQIQASSDCKVDMGVYDQQPLWLSNLPLGRDLFRHTRKYITRNVGDTIPLVGTSCGSPTGIPFAFTEPGNTLELLNPYDRTHANSTLLINGQSGKGKTMAANVIMARFISQGGWGRVIDRAGHYEFLTRLVDGARHIDIGADGSRYTINPWDVADLSQVPAAKVAFLVDLHQILMGEEGLDLDERSKLADCIRNIYLRCLVEGLKARESMLQEELVERSHREKEEGDNPQIAAVYRSLAERLGEFCGDGSYAYFLDRDTNVPVDSPLIVFDTSHCSDSMLPAVMFSTIEFVTRSIESHRDEQREITSVPGGPMFAGKTALLIDEGWHLVSRKETGVYANDLARRARHLGLFLIVMSQQLSDFETEYGLALINNSTMQLFLAQHKNELPLIREAMNLTEEETNIIKTLKTVKGARGYSQMFWINGTRGRGKVSLSIGPIEYWSFTSEPHQDVPARLRALAEHDDDPWAAIMDLSLSGTSYQEADGS